MPISPDMAEDLAAAVADLYEAAEGVLIGKIRRALAEGIDSPTWVEQKLAALGNLQAGIMEIIAALEVDASGAIGQAVAEAYERGVQAAVAELGALGVGQTAAAAVALPTAPVVDRIAQAVIADTGPVHLRMLRQSMDVYREVIGRAAAAPVLGAQTRRQAAQSALDEFANRGVQGFVDRAGRSWNLVSYTEMATRSAVGRAAMEAHSDRLGAAGVDLVIVSQAPEECSLCLVPGTVVEGPVPTGRTRSEYTGDVVRIVTASGKDLTGTPDHPVLTPRGWAALKDLAVGDQVISHDREKGFAGVVPDDVQVPTRIEEAGKAWLPVLLAGPTRRDLNQNVAYRKVRYVPADCDLPSEFDPALSEPVPEHLLVGRVGAPSALLGLDDAQLGLLGPGGAPVGLMHGVEHAGALLGGGVLPALQHSCGCEGGALLGAEAGHVVDDAAVAGARFHFGAAQVVADGSVADPEGGAELSGGLASEVAGDEVGHLLLSELPGASAAVRLDASRGEAFDELPMADVEGGLELLQRLAGTVAADEIVDVSVRHYSGHVWDLSTAPAWYVANGLVTHNCRPWERKVLARTGAPGARTVQVEHPIEDGEMVTVEVAGSLPEARGKGLMHPNCRHTVSAYLPGVSKVPEEQPSRGTYEQSQQQRYYERQVRKWKRRAAAAMDEKDRKAARAKVRAYQAKIRELTAETGLPRKSHREQLTTAR